MLLQKQKITENKLLKIGFAIVLQDILFTSSRQTKQQTNACARVSVRTGLYLGLKQQIFPFLSRIIILRNLETNLETKKNVKFNRNIVFKHVHYSYNKLK